MDTPEYKTISATTEKLRLALQNHLVSIGGALVGHEVIAPDQYTKLRNKMHSEDERAAELIGWIEADIRGGKIKIYHKFIEVLQQDPMYAHILGILQEKYDKFQQAAQPRIVQAQGAAQVKKIKRVQADGNEIEQADDDGEAMDNDEAQSIN